MRELGYCNKGGKLLCKKYNLDWNKFILQGVEESVLLELDEAMATKVVEHAHGR